MRAMIRSLDESLDNLGATILHQFAVLDSRVEVGVPVNYLPLRVPVVEAFRLAVFTLLSRVGVRLHWLLGKRGRSIVGAYEDADLVICAPGGPYFGDIYADHEVVHWFYVWLAVVLSKPVVLYAPSVGPFRNRLLNPLRRHGFRWFRSISLREAQSLEMFSAFTRGAIEATVTGDSALQETIPPALPPGMAIPDERFLVIVAVRDPGDPERARYDAAVLSAIGEVCDRRPDSQVVFLPQLHGPRVRDYPYLAALAERVEGAAGVAVAEETLDSDQHRALIASADLVIAGRYHPAVFAVSAGVPVLVIPYEHKARGLAEAAGIERWTIDAADIDPERLTAMIAGLLDELPAVRDHLEAARIQLMKQARISTDLALRAMTS